MTPNSTTKRRRLNLVEWFIVLIIVAIAKGPATDFYYAMRVVSNADLMRESQCVRNLAAQRISHGFDIRENSLHRYQDECAEDAAIDRKRVLREQQVDALRNANPDRAKQ